MRISYKLNSKLLFQLLQEPLDSLRQAECLKSASIVQMKCRDNCAGSKITYPPQLAMLYFDHRFKDSVEEIGISESQSILSADVTVSESII